MLLGDLVECYNLVRVGGSSYGEAPFVVGKKKRKKKTRKIISTDRWTNGWIDWPINLAAFRIVFFKVFLFNNCVTCVKFRQRDAPERQGQ